ncbi:hypothetical protein NPZ01_15395, partial [Salmonella enterica]|nr:hypothetical protein [Salmonella enterica]
CSPMTSLKTSIKTITYLSDIGCLEIQGASLVTTGSLAYEQLKVLSEEVGTERTLLICCKAFMTEGADFPNLTLVKIPRAILSKCEWDHDDYSFTLNVLSDSEQPDDIDYDENIEDEESL